MLRLQLAVGEVDGKLEVSLNIIGFFLNQPASLQFDRDTEQVFLRGCHQITPLQSASLIKASKVIERRTSFAASSVVTTTRRRVCRMERRAVSASDSLFIATARHASRRLTLMEEMVLTATGTTRVADDSSMFRRICSCNGGSDALGDKYVCDAR